METQPTPSVPVEAPTPEAPTTPFAMNARIRGALARLAPYKKHVPFLLILVVALNLLTINFSLPWGTVNEDNGVVFEVIAINHIRYGLAVTKGQDLADRDAPSARDRFGMPGLTGAAEFNYFLHGPTSPVVYGHHPPLLGLSVAAGFLAFGFHYWVVRLIPLLYALAGLILFYLLMLYLFDPLVARFASLLYAIFPMFAYFGRNVAHEAPTLFWALLLLTGYFHWLREPRRRWLAVMAASVVVGGFYGWPMFYFAVIVFAIHTFAKRRFELPLALVTVLPAVITFALVIAQLDWALGGNLTRLTSSFTERSTVSGTSAPLTLSTWLARLRNFNDEGFGLWAELAMPFALAFVFFRARTEGWSERMRFIAIAFLFGLSHVLVFRGGAFNHAYWQFYFLPFFAITLGWAGVALTRRYLQVPWQRAAVLVGMGVVAFGLNFPHLYALYHTSRHPAFVLLVPHLLRSLLR